MSREFKQIEWTETLQDDLRQLVRLAVREDLQRHFDLTTLSLVGPQRQGRAQVMARQDGVVCGLRAVETVLDEMECRVSWTAHAQDGDRVTAGTALATVHGSARDLLTAERLMLNFLGRLSGVATMTRAYVDQVAGLDVGIYDTRKTTPGWRQLEKYAVRCGGGRNHRTGLFDAVLIKDNHLALVGEPGHEALSAAEAVRQARQFLETQPNLPREIIVEVEVDSLQQLQQVLPQQPDIVLLDNMSTGQLREAVALRDRIARSVQLEASGGVNLSTVREIAQTGVDRISVGALTHSATSLDVALDWQDA